MAELIPQHEPPTTAGGVGRSLCQKPPQMFRRWMIESFRKRWTLQCFAKKSYLTLWCRAGMQIPMLHTSTEMATTVHTVQGSPHAWRSSMVSHPLTDQVWAPTWIQSYKLVVPLERRLSVFDEQNNLTMNCFRKRVRSMYNGWMEVIKTSGEYTYYWCPSWYFFGNSL